MTDTGRNPHGVKFHGDKDWLFCRVEHGRQQPRDPPHPAARIST